MTNISYIPNWVNGQEVRPEGAAWLEKFDPHSGELLCYVGDSSKSDAHYAVDAASQAFRLWSGLTPVKRGSSPE